MWGIQQGEENMFNPFELNTSDAYKNMHIHPTTAGHQRVVDLGELVDGGLKSGSLLRQIFLVVDVQQQKEGLDKRCPQSLVAHAHALVLALVSPLQQLLIVLEDGVARISCK